MRAIRWDDRLGREHCVNLISRVYRGEKRHTGSSEILCVRDGHQLYGCERVNKREKKDGMERERERMRESREKLDSKSVSKRDGMFIMGVNATKQPHNDNKKNLHACNKESCE